jgi:hypothetical protein
MIDRPPETQGEDEEGLNNLEGEARGRGGKWRSEWRRRMKGGGEENGEEGLLGVGGGWKSIVGGYVHVMERKSREGSQGGVTYSLSLSLPLSPVCSPSLY